MKTHKDLDVWKDSIKLVDDIYKITVKFTKEEIYVLTNQIRRSVVSIPSNIAESAVKNRKKGFIKFLYIALGSLAELDTQLIISKNLGYISKEDTFLFKDLEKVKSKILGLIKYLKGKNA